jgi:hypothetical protein
LTLDGIAWGQDWDGNGEEEGERDVDGEVDMNEDRDDDVKGVGERQRQEGKLEE